MGENIEYVEFNPLDEDLKDAGRALAFVERRESDASGIGEWMQIKVIGASRREMWTWFSSSEFNRWIHVTNGISAKAATLKADAGSDTCHVSHIRNLPKAHLRDHHPTWIRKAGFKTNLMESIG